MALPRQRERVNRFKVNGGRAEGEKKKNGEQKKESEQLARGKQAFVG